MPSATSAWAEERALSILGAIDATRTLTLSQFLGSLGMDHLGKRRVELMIRAARGALSTLGDWQSGRLRDAAFAVQAGVPNIGGPIQDGIDSMARVIDRLLAAGVSVLPPQDDPQASSGEVAQPLKTICISGKLPSGHKRPTTPNRFEPPVTNWSMRSSRGWTFWCSRNQARPVARLRRRGDSASPSSPKSRWFG